MKKTWYFTEVALPLYENWEQMLTTMNAYLPSKGERRAVRIMETEPLEHDEAAWKLFVDYSEPVLPENPGAFKHRFRVFDDDGTVYAYGYSSDASSFDPLEDYAAGAWGCTGIEYYDKETDEWEAL